MRRSSMIALTLLWLAAVVYGTHMLSRYEFAPGPIGRTPTDWPAETMLKRPPAATALILFAHPHCPCTRAGLAELARILAQARIPLKTWILFVQPKGTTIDWVHTDLWRQACALPGVTVLADANAREARRFRAVTSGQVVVYGPQGRLLFRGGITDSRGHEGDNPGKTAVIALLQGRIPNRNSHLVFGCSLFNPDEAIQAGGHG